MYSLITPIFHKKTTYQRELVFQQKPGPKIYSSSSSNIKSHQNNRRNYNNASRCNSNTGEYGHTRNIACNSNHNGIVTNQLRASIENLCKSLKVSSNVLFIIFLYTI